MSQQKRKKKQPLQAYARGLENAAMSEPESASERGHGSGGPISGGEETCATSGERSVEKGGIDEEEVEWRSLRNTKINCPKNRGGSHLTLHTACHDPKNQRPCPHVFLMRQFTAGRALHSPCLLFLIYTRLRNVLLSCLYARVTKLSSRVH
jgi:hypothetical protein